MNNVRYNFFLVVAVLSLIIGVCTPHISNPRQFLAGMSMIVFMVCVSVMLWTLIEEPTINTIRKIKYFLFEKRATK